MYKTYCLLKHCLLDRMSRSLFGYRNKIGHSQVYLQWKHIWIQTFSPGVTLIWCLNCWFLFQILSAFLHSGYIISSNENVCLALTSKLSAPEMTATVLASKTAWAEPTVACRTTRHNNVVPKVWLKLRWFFDILWYGYGWALTKKQHNALWNRCTALAYQIHTTTYSW